MSIVRMYIRTFQNEEHADLFLLFCHKLKKECLNNNLKINLTVLQGENNKNQVTSIWKYEDENHMRNVRSQISQYVKMPNSLSPKEVVYSSKVIIDSSD
tara:strand:+ start:56 stop:352 length:297 start_codon:yes stop_codon:yes gene_type:complete